MWEQGTKSMQLEVHISQSHGRYQKCHCAMPQLVMLWQVLSIPDASTVMHSVGLWAMSVYSVSVLTTI